MSSHLSAEVIIGTVVGGAVGIAILLTLFVVCLYFLYKSYRRRKVKKDKAIKKHEDTMKKYQSLSSESEEIFRSSLSRTPYPLAYSSNSWLTNNSSMDRLSQYHPDLVKAYMERYPVEMRDKSKTPSRKGDKVLSDAPLTRSKSNSRPQSMGDQVRRVQSMDAAPLSSSYFRPKDSKSRKKSGSSEKLNNNKPGYRHSVESKKSESNQRWSSRSSWVSQGSSAATASLERPHKHGSSSRKHTSPDDMRTPPSSARSHGRVSYEFETSAASNTPDGSLVHVADVHIEGLGTISEDETLDSFPTRHSGPVFTPPASPQQEVMTAVAKEMNRDQLRDGVSKALHNDYLTNYANSAYVTRPKTHKEPQKLDFSSNFILKKETLSQSTDALAKSSSSVGQAQGDTGFVKRVTSNIERTQRPSRFISDNFHRDHRRSKKSNAAAVEIKSFSRSTENLNVTVHPAPANNSAVYAAPMNTRSLDRSEQRKRQQERLQNPAHRPDSASPTVSPPVRRSEPLTTVDEGPVDEGYASVDVGRAKEKERSSEIINQWREEPASPEGEAKTVTESAFSFLDQYDSASMAGDRELQMAAKEGYGDAAVF